MNPNPPHPYPRPHAADTAFQYPGALVLLASLFGVPEKQHLCSRAGGTFHIQLHRTNVMLRVDLLTLLLLGN